MYFLCAYYLWICVHVHTNPEPLHALPLCYSPLNFWKKKDKNCKTVHQPHYEIWWKKIKNMIVKLLLLENYRIQSLCSSFLHSLFPSFKKFLSPLWESHLDFLSYTSPCSTLPEWVTFTKHLVMRKKNHKMWDLPNKMGVHRNNLLLGQAWQQLYSLGPSE